MKILISDNLSLRGLEVLRSRELFEIDHKVGLKPEELKKIIGNYDGLIVRSETKVSVDLIAAADRLRVIGRAGTGVDNIDVPAATQRGIIVMNAANGNSVTTAEHTIALLMSLARKVPQANAALKSGKWDKKRFIGTELAGKTLGIIGLGNIGKIVASRAIGLAMKVIAFDPYLAKDIAAKAGIELVSHDEVFYRSDFISIHTPLNDTTRNIIDAEAITKMRDGVRILNCARGGLIDEQALYNAVKSGKVAGAALDVFVDEPISADHPLLSLDEIIVTPHLGASTVEAQDQVAAIIAEQVADYLSIGTVVGAVNVPAVSPEALDSIRPYLLLGEKLGNFAAQFVGGAVSEVQINYNGEVADWDIHPITRAILTGLLASASARVNQVNAMLIAEERGLRVIESITHTANDFASLIEVTLCGSNSKCHIGGTLFGRSSPRLVMIDTHRLEIIPEGYMLAVRNDDQPGVVGRIGTFLGEHGINIAQLYLSRNQAGGMAMSVYQVDQELDSPMLIELAHIPHVISVKQIHL